VREEERKRAGLCADCRWAQVIRSDRDSEFYQCRKSFVDVRFSKYPRLPVRECTGHEQQNAAASREGEKA
jgi:hypothetical protein